MGWDDFVNDASGALQQAGAATGQVAAGLQGASNALGQLGGQSNTSGVFVVGGPMSTAKLFQTSSQLGLTQKAVGNTLPAYLQGAQGAVGKGALGGGSAATESAGGGGGGSRTLAMTDPTPTSSGLTTGEKVAIGVGVVGVIATIGIGIYMAMD